MSTPHNSHPDSDLKPEDLLTKISDAVFSLKNLAAALQHPVKDKDINSTLELLRLTISIRVKTMGLETLLNTAIDTEWGM